MSDFIERTERWIAKEVGDGWLPCYSSAAAVSELLKHWRNHKRDGIEDSVLLSDVQAVIVRLKDFQKEMGS